MRKFNQTIEVSFSVDMIADMIREQFKDTFLHADLLVESIITPMVVNNNGFDKARLGHVIGALFGRANTINIVEGAVVNCNETYYSSKDDKQTQIGKATVIEVEAFRDFSQVRIEFDKTDRKGVVQRETSWVALRTLSDWIESEPAPRCDVALDVQEVIVNF